MWPVTHAPKFRNGQIATIVTGAASVVIAAAIVYCSRRWPPVTPQHGVEGAVAEKGYPVEEHGDEEHNVEVLGKTATAQHPV